MHCEVRGQGQPLLMIRAAGGPKRCGLHHLVSLDRTLLGDYNADMVGGDLTRFQRKNVNKIGLGMFKQRPKSANAILTFWL
jgi:hypothetical protein